MEIQPRAPNFSSFPNSLFILLTTHYWVLVCGLIGFLIEEEQQSDILSLMLQHNLTSAFIQWAASVQLQGAPGELALSVWLKDTPGDGLGSDPAPFCIPV